MTAIKYQLKLISYKKTYIPAIFLLFRGNYISENNYPKFGCYSNHFFGRLSDDDLSLKSKVYIGILIQVNYL